MLGRAERSQLGPAWLPSLPRDSPGAMSVGRGAVGFCLDRSTIAAHLPFFSGGVSVGGIEGLDGSDAGRVLGLGGSDAAGRLAGTLGAAAPLGVPEGGRADPTAGGVRAALTAGGARAAPTEGGAAERVTPERVSELGRVVCAVARFGLASKLIGAAFGGGAALGGGSALGDGATLGAETGNGAALGGSASGRGRLGGGAVRTGAAGGRAVGAASRSSRGARAGVDGPCAATLVCTRVGVRKVWASTRTR